MHLRGYLCQCVIILKRWGVDTCMKFPFLCQHSNKDWAFCSLICPSKNKNNLDLKSQLSLFWYCPIGIAQWQKLVFSQQWLSSINHHTLNNLKTKNKKQNKNMFSLIFYWPFFGNDPIIKLDRAKLFMSNLNRQE